MQDMKKARQVVAYKFEMHLPRYKNLAIVQRLSNYRYILHDGSNERKAIVLVSSWDYYEYRCHRGKWHADLLIVEEHNALVPAHVLELTSTIEYRPGAYPQALVREDRKRPNSKEARLFVSELLMDVRGARERLAAMPARTRDRYQKRCEEALRPKIGRPWAS